LNITPQKDAFFSEWNQHTLKSQ